MTMPAVTHAAAQTATTPILYYGIPCNEDLLWRRLLRWVAEGKITPADIVDLDRNYRPRLEDWVELQFQRRNLNALDIQGLLSMCTGTEPGLSVWEHRHRAGVSLERLLPLPAGFAPVFIQRVTPLLAVPLDEIVRLDEVELITRTDTRPDWTEITNRIIREIGRNGGRTITISVVRRQETRLVPPNWRVPGTISDNPVWRAAFGDRDTFSVPFARPTPQRVNVYRVRVLHDPIPIGTGIAIILIALAGILVVDYLSTGSLGSTEGTLQRLLETAFDGVSDIAEAPGRGITNALLLFVVAGGVITLGFIAAARAGGIPTTPFTPPAAPTVGVQVGPPAARVTAGTRAVPAGGAARGGRRS